MTLEIKRVSFMLDDFTREIVVTSAINFGFATDDDVIQGRIWSIESGLSLLNVIDAGEKTE